MCRSMIRVALCVCGIISHLGKPSKKKMCIFHDNLQIGWGGHGLKTHFKKDRNCDKSQRGGR